MDEVNEYASDLEFLVNQQQLAADEGKIGVESFNSVNGVMGVPPWVKPPEGFLSFDEVGVVAVPAIGNPANTVLSFIVPDGYDGVIQRISNNYTGGGFVQGSGDLVWRINIDSRPVKNYSRITVEMGSLNTPRPISGIRVFSGQLVTYTVEHFGSVLPETSTASLSGYYYPIKGE